jgi:hypothetical protein
VKPETMIQPVNGMCACIPVGDNTLLDNFTSISLCMSVKHSAKLDSQRARRVSEKVPKRKARMCRMRTLRKCRIRSAKSILGHWIGVDWIRRDIQNDMTSLFGQIEIRVEKQISDEWRRSEL